MSESLKEFVSLVKQTFQEWLEDKAARLAAAMAYYTVFSIPPLLLIAIAIAGRFFGGPEAAQERIIDQIVGLIGQDYREAIEAMVEGASNPTDGFIAAVVGVVTLLFGASGVFGELQGAMNTIWEVMPKPGRGIMGTI